MAGVAGGGGWGREMLSFPAGGGVVRKGGGGERWGGMVGWEVMLGERCAGAVQCKAAQVQCSVCSA